MLAGLMLYLAIRREREQAARHLLYAVGTAALFPACALLINGFAAALVGG